MGKARILKKQAVASAVARAGYVGTGDSFQNFQARLGYGTGNQTSASSYGIDYLSRNRFRLEAMYRSSWICGKAVDCIAEDMTKKGIEINSLLDPQRISELTALWKNLQLWDKLCDTTKWGRLYGGAIAVLLIDGQKLDTPLRIETIQKDQFKGLLVLDRWVVQPSLTQLIEEYGPNMGLPMYYAIVADGMGIPRANIHHSRVIRIDGQDLPYWQRISEQLWGQSVLERLYDRLIAFDSTTQGAAQLVYKAHLRTYKIKGLREIIAQGGPASEGLLKQIEFTRATQTNEGMTLMDAEDEFEIHSYTFAGLDNILLQFGQQLAGAMNIPLVKLFGQSPAGLNATGESDLRMYDDYILQEQERRYRTPVNILLQVTHRSLFGVPPPEGTEFNFIPLKSLTESEKADIANKDADTVTKLDGIVGPKTQLQELKQSSRVTGRFSNITDQQINSADEDPPEPEMELNGNDNPSGQTD